METAFGIIMLALTAICLWLGLRVYNRRERWAKWTGAGLAIALVVYPLSIGPAWWVECKFEHPKWMSVAFSGAYAPILAANNNGPDWMHEAIWCYTTWWIPRH
jgi:hypothetical protein